MHRICLKFQVSLCTYCKSNGINIKKIFFAPLRWQKHQWCCCSPNCECNLL